MKKNRYTRLVVFLALLLAPYCLAAGAGAGSWGSSVDDSISDLEQESSGSGGIDGDSQSESWGGHISDSKPALQRKQPARKNKTSVSPTSRTSSPPPRRVKSTSHWQEPLTGMEFVKVRGGCFQMGQAADSKAMYNHAQPVHKVCVSGFYMGVYEVTQGQYQKINGTNPAKYKKGISHPVENVSRAAVDKFIADLSRRSGKSFRLPTEAEWEYAARSGGKQQKYSGGDRLDDVAWFYKDSGKLAQDKGHQQVGQKKANGLGLYDMSGNVMEMCSDWHGKYSGSVQKDPKGPVGSQNNAKMLVVRGGSWSAIGQYAQAAKRYWHEQDSSQSDIGFRLVIIDPL